MRNFYYRLITTFFILPIFLGILYLNKIYFYSLLVCILIISFYEISKNVYQSIIKNLLFLLVIFFVFSFFDLRGNTYDEFVYCTWVLTIVWLSDIGGYVFGKLIGGPRLTKYSPNKTIAGFLGSLIFFPIFFFIIIFFL